MAQGTQRFGRPLQDRHASKALPSDRARQHQNSKRDGAEDEVTTAYIKRVLCASITNSNSGASGSVHEQSNDPLHVLLPPLTSSNAVDFQLYAFIAVIMNLFVQAWYNRITPDQQFLGEMVQIIAHCTRGMEQRLRHVDLEALLLDELPDLLTEHVVAVRISQTSRIKTLTTAEKRMRYHTLRPHPALEPVPMNSDTSLQQQENEVAWCLLLVNQILPLLLPPEDLQNPCLDVLVSEIFSELIFRNGICGKACEPWLLWDGIAKILRSTRSGAGQRSSDPASPASRLEEHGLLSSVRSSNDDDRSRCPRAAWTLTGVFWLVVQSLTTSWLLLRSFGLALMQASVIPARTSRPMDTSGRSPRIPVASKRLSDPLNCPVEGIEKQAIIGMRVWGCMSELLSLQRRMPWLSGILSLLQWMGLYGPGQLCCTNSRLDRLMSMQIHERLLNATWLPSVLRAARIAIFPENVLAPARLPPTTAEVLEIKRDCANAIVDTMPHVFQTCFFATKNRDLMLGDIEADLNLLCDPYLNRHLIIFAIELIAARLFPELAPRNREGLDDRRGSSCDEQ